MTKRLLALLLCICMVLSSCAGTASSLAPTESGDSSSSGEEKVEFPTELKEDSMILGKVFGEDVLYTDYRLYLDLEDRAYRDSLKLQMALNCLLELELSQRGKPVRNDEFEAFAADAYYRDMLNYPRLIDELDTAQKLTGLMSDNMDMAVFETYRQSYYLEQLGDMFYAEYEAANPKPDDMDESEYASEAYQYANDKLGEIASDFYERITIPEEDDTLCKIDNETYKMEARHKAFIILDIARNRINIVNSILIGEGIARKLEDEGKTVDLTEFEKQYREYLLQMSEDEAFSDSYGKHLKEMGATMGELLESTFRTLRIMGGYNEAYLDLLTEEYENLPSSDRPETFEEYYTTEYEALCAECLAEHPLG